MFSSLTEGIGTSSKMKTDNLFTHGERCYRNLCTLAIEIIIELFLK